jgi:hypothetical protein
MPDVHHTLGAHGAKISNIEDDIADIKASLARLEAFVAEVNGGKKVAFFLAAAFGGVATWFAQYVMGRSA